MTAAELGGREALGGLPREFGKPERVAADIRSGRGARGLAGASFGGAARACPEAHSSKVGVGASLRTCPACGAALFADMRTCFVCLYTIPEGGVPSGGPPAVDIVKDARAAPKSSRAQEACEPPARSVSLSSRGGRAGYPDEAATCSGETEAPGEDEGASTQAPMTVRLGTPRRRASCRVRVAAPGIALTCDVPEGGVVVGRGSDTGITVGSGAVSRHHLLLTPGISGLLAEDLGATNPTLLNGRPLAGSVCLGEQDVLELRGSGVTLRACLDG